MEGFFATTEGREAVHAIGYVQNIANELVSCMDYWQENGQLHLLCLA
jgi:hypothetical protein